MITTIARTVDAAVRRRYSTVIFLALFLTLVRSMRDTMLWSVDPVAYVAKLLVTLILSTLISVLIHVALHLLAKPFVNETIPLILTTGETQAEQDTRGHKRMRARVPAKRKTAKKK